MRAFSTLLLTSICWLAAAAPGHAQTQVAPPGNAGVDEYLESVPQAEGNRPSGARADPGTLDSGVRADLEAQGADGAAAAELAESTSPMEPAGNQGGNGGSGAGPAPGDGLADEPVQQNGPGDVAGQIAATATGSAGGMGPALPAIIILGALLGAVAMARRRRGA
jgi:hypothetical protein